MTPELSFQDGWPIHNPDSVVQFWFGTERAAGGSGAFSVQEW